VLLLWASQDQRERQEEHARRLHELEREANQEQERLLKEMEQEQSELSARRRAQDAWRRDLEHRTDEQKRLFTLSLKAINLLYTDPASKVLIVT